MLKKFALAFAILAVVLASAGTVPSAGASYKITLVQAAVVNGNDLKAGEYRLTLGTEKVTIFIGKQAVEVPVKIENVDRKFDATAIRYTTVGSRLIVAEIRLGGTKTKLILNP